MDLPKLFQLFQLTTSRRGRRNQWQDHVTEHEFQLTTSRRGRQKRVYRKNKSGGISTHDLTKRSTIYSLRPYFIESISTHDLTKRSTIIFNQFTSYLLFQLTTSRRGRLLDSLSITQFLNFNSRPHEEVDKMQLIKI